MGLITALVTLPLAPVRGVGWIAERLYERAWEEAFSEAAIRRELTAAQRDLEEGRMTEQDYDDIEEVLIQRLIAAKGTNTNWPAV
jgi:gas vesicle protein GvpG